MLQKEEPMILNILAIMLGLALLIIGADLLVKGASNIAKKFHIPEILIGLSIVAIGTSMPELMITVTSAQKGAMDLIVGNSIGSDLCNLLFILGLMAIIRPIPINKQTKKIHIPMAFLSTVIIFVMSFGLLGSEPNVLNRGEGILLLILFSLYILYPIVIEIQDIKKAYQERKNKKEEKKINALLSVLFMGIGFVLLKIGGDFVVDNAVEIAQYYNVSQRVIGLTIVAMGTALPELITSIVAVVTKETDIAVGNLIGSSVLNSFLILGLGAVITDLAVSGEFVQNIILLIATTALLWLFMYLPKKDTITRTKGVILISIFILYLVKLFI